MTDPDEVERLMDVACTEAATIADLDECVARPQQPHQSVPTLSQLDSATLRRALNTRRRTPGEGGNQ